jgi:superfamily II DNA or RNA helicase
LCNSWKKKEDFLRIDGRTNKEGRQEVVDKFNNPSSPSKLLLVTTTAGGIGTNLIGANRAVLMDVSWNPTTDQQAIFRLFRLGQKKKVRFFFFYFLKYVTLRYRLIIFPDPFNTDRILERIHCKKLKSDP